MTRKPCPGCGEVHRDRKPDTVCRRCQNKLDDYEKMRERVNALSPGRIVVSTHARHYANRGFYETRARRIGSSTREVAQRALHNLIQATSTLKEASWEEARDAVRVIGWRNPGEGFKAHDWVQYRIMDEALPPLFTALYWGIIDMLDAAYEDGLDKGKNFVVAMANGEYDPDTLRKT